MTESTALSAFVAGTISFQALRNAIAETTEFLFVPAGGIRITSRRRLPRTIITPTDVQRVLARYKDGQLTLEELSIWGLVVNALAAFELEGATDSDAENVWDVIAQLSVASVNDAFTPHRASTLLEQIGRVISG